MPERIRPFPETEIKPVFRFFLSPDNRHESEQAGGFIPQIHYNIKKGIHQAAILQDIGKRNEKNSDYCTLFFNLILISPSHRNAIQVNIFTENELQLTDFPDSG